MEPREGGNCKCLSFVFAKRDLSLAQKQNKIRLVVLLQAEKISGIVRTHSTTTGDRNLEDRGAVSSEYFGLFSSGFISFVSRLIVRFNCKEIIPRCGENCRAEKKSKNPVMSLAIMVFSVPTLSRTFPNGALYEINLGILGSGIGNSWR